MCRSASVNVVVVMTPPQHVGNLGFLIWKAGSLGKRCVFRTDSWFCVKRKITVEASESGAAGPLAILF